MTPQRGEPDADTFGFSLLTGIFLEGFVALWAYYVPFWGMDTTNAKKKGYIRLYIG